MENREPSAPPRGPPQAQLDVSAMGFVPSSSIDLGAKEHFALADFGRCPRRDSLQRMQQLAATYDTLQEQLQHMAKRPAAEPPTALGDRTNTGAAATAGSAATHLPPSGKPPPHHHACSTHHAQAATPQAAPHHHMERYNAAAPQQPASGQTHSVSAAGLTNDALLNSSSVKAATDGNASTNASNTLFEYLVGNKDSQVARHAAEILQDQELLELCEDGLNRQLTRTKDGATERSRIQELAGKT